MSATAGLLIEPAADTPRVRTAAGQLAAMLDIPVLDHPDGEVSLRVVAAARPGTGEALQVVAGPAWDRVDDVAVTWLDDVPVLYREVAERPRALVEDGVVGFDLLGEIELLLGREWAIVPDRDLLGRFRQGYSILDDLGLASVAVLDRAARALGRRLPVGTGASAERGFVVALTHDLDGAFEDAPSLRKARHLLARGAARGRTVAVQAGLVEVARVARHGLRSGPRRFAFDPWVAAERALGVSATYLSFGDYEDGRDPDDAWYRLEDCGTLGGVEMSLADALRRLGEDGFEVGLHQSIASFDDPARLAREAETLARACGRRPASARAHYLRFEPRTSAPALAAAGITTDASVGGVGFARGTASPFPLPAAPRDVLEIPTVLMDDLLFREHRAGLTDALARRRIERILTEVRDVGGTVAVLFHADSTRHLETYRWLVEWIQEQGGACVTLAEAARRWARRAGTS